MNKERSAIAPLSALELVHDRHAKKKKTKLRGSGIPIVLLRVRAPARTTVTLAEEWNHKGIVIPLPRKARKPWHPRNHHSKSAWHAAD